MIFDPANLQQLYQHFEAYSKKIKKSYSPESKVKLLKPLLLKGFFSFSKEEWETIVKGIFSDIHHNARETLSEQYRVYINGNLSYKAYDTLLRSSPSNKIKLEEWLSHILCAEQYGVVINDVEKWSDELAELALTSVAKIRTALGENNTRISLSLIIGNYGFTPFGVHLDDPYSSTIHFHFGPGDKLMHLWDNNIFLKQKGMEIRYHPEKINGSATTFSIESGDVFVLPPHFWHIGENPDFSIGLTVTLTTETDESLTEISIARSLSELSAQNDITVTNWRKEIVSLFRLSIESHRGLATPVKLFKTEFSIDNTRHLKLSNHFPLLIKTVSNRPYLFFRGHKILLKDSELMFSMKKLLEQQKLTKSELSALLSINSSNCSEFDNVLIWLARTGAIKYV